MKEVNPRRGLHILTRTAAWKSAIARRKQVPWSVSLPPDVGTHERLQGSAGHNAVSATLGICVDNAIQIRRNPCDVTVYSTPVSAVTCAGVCGLETRIRTQTWVDDASEVPGTADC